MQFRKGHIADILSTIDLGASVAEMDNLLEAVRVETSVYSDLYNDRVDLIPGTKGSGKSALYRIFVNFLPPFLLEQRRIVIAHGVQTQGDSVFHAFKNRFESLTEADFVNFWCIYFVSLANEHFIKNQNYQSILQKAPSSVRGFREACHNAQIPEFKDQLPLSKIIEWTLNALRMFKPKLGYTTVSGETYSLSLFEDSPQPSVATNVGIDSGELPIYINRVRSYLDTILANSDHYLWLMVDRLDEIFERRSETETRALRGLLRTTVRTNIRS